MNLARARLTHSLLRLLSKAISPMEWAIYGSFSLAETLDRRHALGAAPARAWTPGDVDCMIATGADRHDLLTFVTARWVEAASRLGVTLELRVAPPEGPTRHGAELAAFQREAFQREAWRAPRWSDDSACR
jgi:hypothetical protein